MIVPVLERQAGQVKPGDPALGAPVQRGQLIVMQRDLPFAANERHGFFKRETQILRADFQQLATGANPPQADARR
ncbi:hypothetical protein D3C85_1701030 [compost metagenome]